MTEATPQKTEGQTNQNNLELQGSRQFASWLADEGITLAFSTYQAGKFFFIGTNPDSQASGERKLYIYNRTIERCMGLCAGGLDLYVSSLYQIYRFRAPDASSDLPMFLPRMSYYTGDIDAHDMALEDARGPGGSRRLVFAATLFNCVATIDEEFSFRPIWKPPFISKLVPEDRCHLNGLALRDGKARYVTAVSKTNVVDGWREHRQGGGIVMDMESGDVIAEGLSMPHSPRWHHGELYLNEAGTGIFGKLDDAGKLQEIAFCPGFLRGMALYKNFAIVGISKERRERAFQGLPLQERLDKEGLPSRCALLVIDLNSGAIVHSLNIEGVVEEIFDIAVLPGMRRAGAIGFQSDEVRRVLSLDPRDVAKMEG